MALPGIDIDITWIASVVSVIFALSIAFQAYFVYRRTGREHFRAYSAAFSLLAVSYALLIPLAFGAKLPTIGYETSDILAYPPRIVISTIGFAILALSYTTTRRVRQILYGLVALLVMLVLIVLLPQAPMVPYAVDTLLFLLHSVLLAYISFRMLQATKSVGLVLIGFLILLVSQCVSVVASLRLEETTILISETLRVVSFGLLFAALAITIRPKSRAQLGLGEMTPE